MKLSKIALLAVLLGLGAVVEAAYQLRHHLVATGAGWRFFGERFSGPSFSFEEKVELDAAVEIEISNELGDVLVRGGDVSRVSVQLRREAFAGTEAEARKAAELVHLAPSRTGDRLLLGTNRKDVVQDEVSVATHLTLEVPRGTKLLVRNQHGSVDVGSVAEADVDSAHDDVRIEDVAGKVRLQLRHGESVVRRVSGELDLDCRFGDATLEDVGPTNLKQERGGLLGKRLASLKLEVAQGDVDVEDVAGDLSVEGEHSSITGRRIGGSARVTAKIGEIELLEVRGRAEARAEHGGVRLRAIQGSVFASSVSDSIELEDVTGAVEVEVEHGGLSARGLRGGLVARVSGDDLELLDVAGAVHIEARRANVKLNPALPLTAPIEVSSQHGGIELGIPPGAALELDASSVRGEVQVELHGFQTTESSAERVAGKLGSGGPLVKLAAEHGDVSVRTLPAPAAIK